VRQRPIHGSAIILIERNFELLGPGFRAGRLQPLPTVNSLVRSFEVMFSAPSEQNLHFQATAFRGLRNHLDSIPSGVEKLLTEQCSRLGQLFASMAPQCPLVDSTMAHLVLFSTAARAGLVGTGHG
jgi:hypothetical protein